LNSLGHIRVRFWRQLAPLAVAARADRAGGAVLPGVLWG
jgi:hypothetical protein